MKSIVNKQVCKEIFVEQLDGNEIIAYRCKNSEDKYAVLARLHHFDSCGNKSYGFIPLGESDSNPRYVANTWFESVKLASKSRELKVFDSCKEMIAAMKDKCF